MLFKKKEEEKKGLFKKIFEKEEPKEEKGFLQNIFNKEKEEEPQPTFFQKVFQKEEEKKGIFDGVKESLEEKKKERRRKAFLRSLIPTESTAIRFGIVLFMILIGMVIFILVEKYSIYFVQKDEFRTGLALFSVILYLPFARKITKALFVLVPFTLITLLALDIMEYYEYIEGNIGMNRIIEIFKSLTQLRN
jgi:hypothetical protein